MPVNTGDNGNNQPTQGQKPTTLSDAFATAGLGAGDEPKASRPRSSGGSFLNFNARFKRPVSRMATGEAVTKFSDAINKELKANLGDSYKDHFKVSIFDNNVNSVPLSAILVCLQATGQKNSKHVLVYTLLVEASRGHLANRVVTINNQPVEIDTVPGDFADPTLWGKIETYLGDSYGSGDVKLHNAGSMVLPSELDGEDVEHVRRVVFNVTQALYTMMDSAVTGEEQPITVADLTDGVRLQAILDYNPGNSDSATGLPVRSDLSITIRATKANANQQTQDLNTGVLDATRVDGYVDLAYADPEPSTTPYQAATTQRYYPRFIITRLDSQVDAITSELQLAALSSSTMLARGTQWAMAFQPRWGGNKKELNLRDIGAIGYECSFSPDPSVKPAGRIDTQSSDFDKQKWWQMLTMAIHDNLSYAIDVEENGELSWLHSSFLAAARGDQRAYDDIVRSADNLTGGAFSKIWTGDAIAVDDNNRIALGYFMGPDGEKHDLREIDYLAMLNIAGAQDMPKVIQWSDSFQRTDVPDILRLEMRNKFLKNWNKTTEIKGYAQRVNFTNAFITALSTACAQAGLVVQQNNVLIDTVGGAHRSNYNPGRFAVNGQQLGNMWNVGQPTYGNYRGHQGGIYGRWS